VRSYLWQVKGTWRNDYLIFHFLNFYNMLKSVVRKVSYKKLTQSELATFAANVHQRMASRPEY